MRVLFPSCLLALALAACGAPSDDAPSDTGGGSPTADAAIELLGTWSDNYGGTTAITTETWGADTVVRYDNAANWAVVQAPADAQYGPSKFSKLVWTQPASDAFWLCTVDFGLDTADAALATSKRADASKPAEGGCGGFPWTQMTLKK